MGILRGHQIWLNFLVLPEEQYLFLPNTSFTTYTLELSSSYLSQGLGARSLHFSYIVSLWQTEAFFLVYKHAVNSHTLKNNPHVKSSYFHFPCYLPPHFCLLLYGKIQRIHYCYFFLYYLLNTLLPARISTTSSELRFQATNFLNPYGPFQSSSYLEDVIMRGHFSFLTVLSLLGFQIPVSLPKSIMIAPSQSFSLPFLCKLPPHDF